MQEVIHERVGVVSIYNLDRGTVMPVKIRWRGREYVIQKLGYYYKRKEGKTLLHIFSVATDTMFFKLCCNGDTLHWMLEEVSDGLAN